MRDKVGESGLLSARYGLMLLAVAGIYVLSAELGRLLSHPEAQVALLRPAAGVALAAILLLGVRAWPGILIGGLAVAILEGHPPPMWIGGPAGNTLGAVAGAWVLQRYTRFETRLERVQDVVSLAAVGGLLGAAVSATLGAGTLAASGRLAAEPFSMAWLMWWLGDTVSVMVVAPPLLVFGTLLREGWRPAPAGRRAVLDLLLPFAVLVAANYAIFCAGVFEGAHLPVAFAAFPALIWIAVRFGIAGASVAVLITAVMTGVGVALGSDPFSGHDAQQDLISLWAFAAVVALTVLPLGAAMADRQRTRQRLEESETRYRALFEQASDALFVHSEDDEILDANRRAGELLGYSRNELLAMKVSDLQAPEVRERTEGVIKRELALYGGAPFETVDVHRDGTRIPVEVSTSRLEGTEGKLVLSVVRDIRERKQAEEEVAHYRDRLEELVQERTTELVKAEEALRESREQLALALKGANDGLWDWNLETDEVYYSPRWKEMLGYEDHEIENRFSEWERLTEPEAGRRSQAMLEDYLAGKTERFEFEFQMRHKDGHYVDILSRAFAVRRAPDGKPVRVVGTHVDITARKRAEEALRASEEKLRGIVEYSPDGIVLIDEEGRIVEWNPGAAQLIGRERDEVLGRPLWDVQVEMAPQERRTPEVRQAIRARILGILEGGQTPWVRYAAETEIVLPDGTLRTVQSVLFLIDAGEGYRAGSILRDITERRRIEEALRESEQLLRTIAANYPAYFSIIEMTEEGMITGFTSGKEFERQDLDPEAFVGLKLEDVFGEHAPFVREQYQKAFEGQEVSFELSMNDQHQFYNVVPLYEDDEVRSLLSVVENITERVQAEQALRQRNRELAGLNTELQAALDQVKALSGLLPICASCKKIRDDEGYWHQVEVYLLDHSEAKFSHGICPDCAGRLYPGLDLFDDEE